MTLFKKLRCFATALNTRALYSVHKGDKCQSLNLDNWFEIQSDKLKNQKWKTFCRFLQMSYAYGLLKLHPENAKHCNFQIIRGKRTQLLQMLTWILRISCHSNRNLLSVGLFVCWGIQRFNLHRNHNDSLETAGEKLLQKVEKNWKS